ncbi:hypothetical protein PybrP1_007192 [[Pythium] brassicae (nom. inval.)]|nr:hypothetical protein PybrP1_007192 [[Pythium] brassicae (nom. inval.)]
MAQQLRFQRTNRRAQPTAQFPASSSFLSPEAEELIFSFDELNADGETTFTSLASFETRAANPRRITFESELARLRPPNPVAGLLQSRSDDDDDDNDDDDDELREFAPKMLRSISAPPPRHSGGLTPPAIDLFSCGGLEPFDSGDRRKRKSMDDAVVGGAAGRIRPRAKRAKSFSFAAKPEPPLVAALAAAVRSESISIPRTVAARGASRARSGDAHSSSPSWNATASSLEYFCRRSLDVSSPLRLRFRDLMVGSVGRAASYTGP